MSVCVFLDHVFFWLMRRWQRLLWFLGVNFYITCSYCGSVLPLSRNAVARHMEGLHGKEEWIRLMKAMGR